MKKTIKIAFILLFSSTVNAASEQQMIMESKQAIHHFSQQLKSKLQQGMLLGGPVAAIQVCNTAAEEIAQQVSEQFGWKIACTSLKVRNDENAAGFNMGDIRGAFTITRELKKCKRCCED
ncbi:MAG: DUF3365 domain-containing protein [Methylococcaceae bacterium]